MTITIKKLQQAADQGLIDNDKVTLLFDFINESNRYKGEEDSLKFLASYSDFFISLGIMLLSIACIAAADTFKSISGVISWASIIILLFLGHWLIKIQRRKISGIVINLFVALLLFLSLNMGAENVVNLDSAQTLAITGLSVVYKSIILSACLLCFFWYFRLPFSLAVWIGSLFYVLMAFLDLSIESIDTWRQLSVMLIFLSSGFVVFFIAMFLDAKDKHRNKLASDYAFWLHMTAAPLIIFSSQLIISGAVGDSQIASTLLTYAVTLILTLVAIYVDRRSLLTSSIILLIVISLNLLNQQDVVEQSTGFLIVFASLGFMIVIVGGFWYKIRNMLFARLNLKLDKYVPPFDGDLYR